MRPAWRPEDHASYADDDGEGEEEEAEEDQEDGAQEALEGFLGEASVPLNAAQVGMPTGWYLNW